MKMNRRQALIGIGSLAVGSGAALGSGAFTSVEASRDVSVTTTGDASALLGIAPAGPYTSDASSDSNAVEIDIGGDADGGSGGLNDDAITELGEVIEFTNNAEAGVDETNPPDVDVSFLNDSDNEVQTVGVEIEDNGNVVAVVELTAPSNSLVSGGDSRYATATVYTGDQTGQYTGGTTSTQGEVTIDATDSTS